MLALLQFDSASLALLEKMLADGRLPTLAALRERGQWETMDARATLLQSSTYMTLCTGVHVRDHGVYSAVPWSAREQRPRFMYSFPHPPTIWERITASGRRSLVIDPVLAWSPEKMEGVYMSGWQFEDRMTARGWSVPSSLRNELGRRFGKPPHLDDVYGTRSIESLMEWRRRLVEAPTRVAEAAMALMKNESFDFLWLNFSAAHKAGHHLWDPGAVIDEKTHGADVAKLRNGLFEVYQAVDKAIARIIDSLPAGTDLIVFSPTGMAANTSRADLLPGMLDAVFSPTGSRQQNKAAKRSPIWALRAAVPLSFRDRVARLLPDNFVADIATRMYLNVDWTRTRAMTVPGENKGYIRFNLKGREREGIVDGGELNDLTREIEKGLLTFRDPDGTQSITRVERMTDITNRGSHIGELPDLIVHWGEGAANNLHHVTSSVHGDVVRRGVGSGRSGNHVDEAWAIILPGNSRRRDIGRQSNIMDIGATACALMGGDQSGLSGSSLLEAV